MRFELLAALLESFPLRLDALVRGLPDGALRFRASEKDWSIIEIVGHLVDEEKLDFRVKLRSTLETPTKEWPAIDPPRWVSENKHQEASLDALLAEFARERAASVAWLRSLESPDWNQAHMHPKFGAMSAGELMVSWAAHDTLHIRQIGKCLHRFACASAPEFSAEYAGPIPG